jgi:adenylylsulfate kinase
MANGKRLLVHRLYHFTALTNIHPIFDRLISKTERERRTGQRGRVLWFTGLSGSGKSTLAVELERRLYETGYQSYVLDGDNIRSGINNNLGFTEEDRVENIRRIAEVSKLFIEAGIITLNCFISPTRAMRAKAKEIIGSEDFIEIYIDTPLEICEARDVKGLYAKARKGEIKNFTGIDAPFEAPEKPALTVRTENKSPEECIDELFEFVLPKVRIY